MVNAPTSLTSSKPGYQVVNKNFLAPALVRLRHVVIDWSRFLVNPGNAGWFERNLSFDDLLSSPIARNGQITLYAEQDLKNKRPPKIYISKAQFDIISRWLVEDEVASVKRCTSTFDMRWLVSSSPLGRIEARVFNEPEALREFVQSEAVQTDTGVPSKRQKLKLSEKESSARTTKDSKSPSPESASTPSTPPATSPEPTCEPPLKKVKLAKFASAPTTSAESSQSVSAPPIAEVAVFNLPLPPVFDVDECSIELADLRARYAHAARHGGAAFLSLDVETWERGHDALLEVGWTCVDFTAPSSSSSNPDSSSESESESTKHGSAASPWATVTRTDQHVVIAENIKRRNGRFSPDARDDWDFGPSSRGGSVEPAEITPAAKKVKGVKGAKGKGKANKAVQVPPVFKTDSLLMGLDNVYALLAATFETLTSSEKDKQLFLIFHDPRMDLKALGMLGFENDFAKPVMELAQAKTRGKADGKGEDKGSVWIVDTQRVYAGWKGFNQRRRLERCCEELEVATKRLHNAGNDAHYTLELFERMMDPKRKPVLTDTIVEARSVTSS
ncbi:BQ2448_7339 [Microbotryum intermedium]|uniref:BQ2448_7339 protein n=1 Tax=Microbotryum intermedium TaxID=269621 RepID=A0A238FN26_9BASI|nr:BQ2448_7339 [Microbotryum intermedium]